MKKIKKKIEEDERDDDDDDDEDEEEGEDQPVEIGNFVHDRTIVWNKFQVL